MIALALEPEPLAFRVRPQTEECFDSWIERVAAAHETTRGALFRHLGIEPALAGLDLARGKRDLDQGFHADFDRMVARLAWAVQSTPERVEQTFLDCDARALLPRRRRHYACSRCWYEAQRSAKPMIILREWILRASWRCRHHGLPLSAMGQMHGEAGRRRSLADLAGTVLEAERLRWKFRVNPAAVRRNTTTLDDLTRPAEGQGLGMPDRPYQARFAANHFHFASDRIAMLALAHGSRHGVARRFERLVSARLPERPTSGGDVLTPEKRPYRLRPCFRPKPCSRWVAPELAGLLRAYAEVRKRWDTASALEAVLARHL